MKHLRDIHRFIFSDIYEWSGEIRGGDFLIKDDSIFCRAMYIESYAAEMYEKLQNENFLKGLSKQTFVERLAYFMGEVNALHPFREGNGRTARLYFKHLCKNAGYDLEFRKTQKATLLYADISAFNRDYEHSREGTSQAHRADISHAWGNWLKENCELHNVPVIESRPWDIDPPIEVCQANSNHPPKRGDCDTNIAERFNWCRNSLMERVIMLLK